MSIRPVDLEPRFARFIIHDQNFAFLTLYNTVEAEKILLTILRNIYRNEKKFWFMSQLEILIRNTL